MKIRDSGMPDEAYWETLFDVPLILSRLGIGRFHDVAELGCGYGTFSIPIAKAISGTLYTFDVDPAMLARTRAAGGGSAESSASSGTSWQDGFGVDVDAVLLFNILHCDEPVQLLRHAANSLTPAASAGNPLAIRRDASRSRAYDIRPKPEQIIEWARQADLEAVGEVIDLPPWHYGIRLARPSN